MADDISMEHDELQGLLDEAARIEEDGETTRNSVDDSGIDPATAAALRGDKSDEKEDSEDSKENTEKSEKANREAEELGNEAARDIDATDTEVSGDSGSTGSGGAEEKELADMLSKLTDGGGSPDAIDPSANAAAAPSIPQQMPQQTYSGMGYTPTSALNGPLNQSTMLGGASPTPAIAPQQYAASMQSPGAVDYSNYTPQAGTATQYDANNAPDKEALRQAIYDYINAGESGDGSDLSEPRIDGGGDITTNPDDPEHVIEVKNLAKDYVATEMEYAWGGGHGAEPGPTQGISDGGGAADANGDYNKIGLDCSGLSRDFTYNAYGVDIGAGTAADQYNSGQPVSADAARPGDIFFPDSAGRPPMHVQVYIGDGQVLEAQQSGTKLMVSELESGEFRRFVE